MQIQVGNKTAINTVNCRDLILALGKKTCFHVFHQVELGSDDFSISAVQERLRYRETSRIQGVLHPILPVHLQMAEVR